VLQQQEVQAAHDAGDLRCVALLRRGLGAVWVHLRRRGVGRAGAAAAAQGQRLHGEDDDALLRDGVADDLPLGVWGRGTATARPTSHLRLAPSSVQGRRWPGGAVEALPFKVVCAGLDWPPEGEGVRQRRRVAVGTSARMTLQQQRWSTATVAAAASAAAASNKVAAAALSKQACVRAVPARHQ